MSDSAKPLDRLVDLLNQSRRSVAVTNDLKKRHLGSITGVIASVEDPAEKGRVLVKLDSFKQDYIAEEWAYVVGAYEGIQPKQLIGAKCLIAPLEGSTHLYRVIGILDGDIGTYDPNTPQGEYDHNLDSNDYAKMQSLKPLSVNTGIMFRLPVYSKPAGDNLPDCHTGNQGAVVIFDDGLNSYHLSCLRVKGGFSWIKAPREKI